MSQSHLSLNPVRAVLGRRSRPPESSVASDGAPPTAEKRREQGWGVVREGLRIVERCSDVFPPLKTAVAGLLSVMEHVEVCNYHHFIENRGEAITAPSTSQKVKATRDELIEIAGKIEALRSALPRHVNDLPRTVRERLVTLTE